MRIVLLSAHMKIFFGSFLHVVVLLCFFASCSEKKSADSYFNVASTLRYAADEKAKSAKWTDEIEADRLSSDIFTFATIEKSVPLSPSVLSASLFVSKSDGIFPYLEGFGSLDVSGMIEEVKIVLDGFCSAISKGNDADSFIEKTSLYELVFFYEDLKTGWKEKFHADFPTKETKDKSQDQISEQPEEQNEEENEMNSQNEEENAFYVFSSFLYSTPFESADSYEVPVRFFADAGFIDTVIFFSSKTETWKIDQIQIKRWEKTK